MFVFGCRVNIPGLYPDVIPQRGPGGVYQSSISTIHTGTFGGVIPSDSAIGTELTMGQRQAPSILRGQEMNLRRI